MKAFYLPLAILISALLLSLWAGRYTREETAACAALLSQAEQQAQHGNWAQAQQLLQESHRLWESRQAVFHTIMDHRDLEEAEALFKGVMVSCRERDAGDFYRQKAQLQVQLTHLAETQSFSLQNVL